MREREFIFDGFRTLAFFGDKYTITYNAKKEIIVIENEVFNGINGFKVFRSNKNLAEGINEYLVDMNLESGNITDELVSYLAITDGIMEGLKPINNSTWKTVVESNLDSVGYLDLGTGRINCYSDGELELMADSIISLGNIEDIKKSSIQTAKDLIRNGLGVCHGITVLEIVRGIDKLYEIYKNIDKRLKLKVEKTPEPQSNLTREMMLCTIAVRSTQLVDKGCKWKIKRETAGSLYKEVYLEVYKKYIASGGNFTLEFVDNTLKRNFFNESKNLKVAK